MSVLRYVLPALAVAQSALAASCSVSATTTITNAADATGLSGCSTFSGSIAVATGAAGDISLSGIEELDGNLVSADAGGLTALSAASLETISGTFSLENMTTLASLSFPKLTTVDTISWIALPNLQQLSFTSGVKTADNVNIQNTQLNSLDGINLKTVGSFICANNRFLNKIEAQLTNITGGLTLEGNGDSLQVSFPNLVSAKNMTFHNCSSVSLPSLKTLEGSLGFYSNVFESFSGPNLTSVGGALAFNTNSKLSNISLPLLTSITAAFQLANNTALKIVDGFPKLKTVGGALDFYGNFTSVDLPSLSSVEGGFNLQSSGNVTASCSHFLSIAGANKVIKGKITCVGEQEKPGDASTTPTSTGSASGSTKTSAAGGHLDVSSSAVMGLSGVLAAIFGLL